MSKSEKPTNALPTAYNYNLQLLVQWEVMDNWRQQVMFNSLSGFINLFGQTR
jgi:hypothetical protein